MILNDGSHRSRYYAWLVSQVELRYGCEHILQAMDRVVFREIIPNDDNRAGDGIALRDEFFKGTHHLEEECSFLEMLVALSRRIHLNTIQPVAVENPIGYWFWRLVENMELYDSMNVYIDLKRVVAREYGPSGNGGLFPLMNPSTDQRYVEVWYQMMEWIHEN